MEESQGLNLYEMDVRSYDPTIARWTSIDPIVHWSFSTYSAFDNTPIYWADPSGADSWANPFNKDTSELIQKIWEASGYKDETRWKTLPDGSQGQASTYIDKTGKIIKHVDDNDSNIYLVEDVQNWDGSSKGLTVVGVERSGVEYKVGNYVINPDLRGYIRGFDSGIITKNTPFDFSLPWYIGGKGGLNLLKFKGFPVFHTI